MHINSLIESYAVSGQIQPSDIAALKDAGFVSIVCNRPDEEVSGDESSAAIKAAAQSAGLAFTFNPVTNGAMTQANVETQGAALAAADGPVFAYCRSGMRSSVVWALSQAGTTPVDDLIAAAARGGYDLSGLRPMIEAAAR